ncbi:MAG TPA: acyl-ACP desaturase [Dehalococcoidia bacterium]|nr:acyl-ACP desaturase [Dehalococcoidia bacterium]
MVYLTSSPWTTEGRYNAIRKAVAEIYDHYFRKGPRWIAKHLPERAQMGEWASRVSPETKEMLLGDYGVESYIEDYAQMAILASGDSISTRQIYTQWVFDEMRHPKALWYAMSDSGLYSEHELADYTALAGEDTWTFERQTGHEATPERGAAYAIAQERQTKRNYQALQKRIWGEYGEPTDNGGHPYYPAIAGVCRTLSIDEGFHEAVFRKITLAYLQYWPDKAIQAMWDVYEKYRMPIVKLPNLEVFFQTVLDTGIESPRSVIKDVLQPTYEALGFESRAALKKAARASWDLPEGALIQVGDEPPPGISDDAIPYKMSPDGTLTPVAA